MGLTSSPSEITKTDNTITSRVSSSKKGGLGTTPMFNMVITNHTK